MADSFFYGTDAEIASGAANFSARISATPTAYRLAMIGYAKAVTS